MNTSYVVFTHMCMNRWNTFVLLYLYVSEFICNTHCVYMYVYVGTHVMQHSEVVRASAW